jgi:uncharacterized protein (TIGR03437 family)
LVYYADGNLRLKPHPPLSLPDVCFGSSVLVGGAAAGVRPIAEVASVRYVSASRTIEVNYTAGGAARIILEQVDRSLARLRVAVAYPIEALPFATFRSMYVNQENADAERMMWRDSSGALRDEPVTRFGRAEGNDFFFYRRTRSRHNTSAPDIRIRVVASLPPVISSPTAVNAASFLPGSVAPGEIVTVFGSAIGPCFGTGPRLTRPGFLDSEVGNTRVLFDDVPAPLVYVSSSQVSAVVPYSVARKTSVKVQIEHQGSRSNTVMVPVAEAAHGIFTIDSSGKGQGAILNQDGTVNSASNPALTGSIVSLYATGEGETEPAGVDGRIAGDVLPKPLLPVSALIDGISAEILYAGAAPGLVAGVLQVNARVPQGVLGSGVPVVLAIGTGKSQPGVTMAVRPSR